jgi:hypothetical protein
VGKKLRKMRKQRDRKFEQVKKFNAEKMKAARKLENRHKDGLKRKVGFREAAEEQNDEYKQ